MEGRSVVVIPTHVFTAGSLEIEVVEGNEDFLASELCDHFGV